MRTLFFALILVVFLLLQITVLPYFESKYVKPDLLLIFVFLVSIRLEFFTALVLSMISGFLKDIAGVQGAGLYVLIFPFWSFVITRISKKIVIDNFLFSGIAMGALAFVNAVLVRLIMQWYGWTVTWPNSLRICAIESFYTAVLLPCVMLLVEAIRLPGSLQRKSRREEPL